LGIKPPRDGDQALSEVAVNAPVACGVGIGQGVARDQVAAQAHVIELGGLGAKARFDVAQTLSVSQLREGHAQVLVEAGEALDLVFACVTRDTAPQRGQRQMLHQLCEHELALVHRCSLRRSSSQGRRSADGDSNRDQTKPCFSEACSKS
jgi:hypothetical protein